MGNVHSIGANHRCPPYDPFPGDHLAAAQRAEGRPFDVEPHIWCVTASLKLDYLKPTPIAGPITLRARAVRGDSRKIPVTCSLLVDGVETVRAEVLAIRVPSTWRA